MSLDRKTAAAVLREAAALLEVQGENVHRIRALANASRVVERIEGDLEALVESGEILELKGVGKGTATILKQLGVYRSVVKLFRFFNDIHCAFESNGDGFKISRFF